MRKIVIAVAIGMLACVGGGSPDEGGDGGSLATSASAIDVTMRNDYAESLFTITYAVNGGAAVTVATRERIPAGESKTFAAAINAAPGDAVTMTVVGTSLGNDRRWELSGPKPAAAVSLTYDWDTATGSFRLRSNWGT